MCIERTLIQLKVDNKNIHTNCKHTVNSSTYIHLLSTNIIDLYSLQCLIHNNNI